MPDRSGLKRRWFVAFGDAFGGEGFVEAALVGDGVGASLSAGLFTPRHHQPATGSGGVGYVAKFFARGDRRGGPAQAREQQPTARMSGVALARR